MAQADIDSGCATDGELGSCLTTIFCVSHTATTEGEVINGYVYNTWHLLYVSYGVFSRYHAVWYDAFFILGSRSHADVPKMVDKPWPK